MPQVTSVTFTFGGDDEEMNKKRHGYKWHLSYHKAIGLLDSFKAKARVLSPPHMKVFVRRWGLQWELRWCIEWRTSCWWSDGSYDGMGSVLSENIGGIPSQEPSWDEEWETVYHRRLYGGPPHRATVERSRRHMDRGFLSLKGAGSCLVVSSHIFWSYFVTITFGFWWSYWTISGLSVSGCHVTSKF